MGQSDLQCPVCTEPLSELAKPLPYSHCAQSHLICALSGKVMDDNNPPMALPNGHIYGENVSEWILFWLNVCILYLSGIKNNGSRKQWSRGVSKN